MEKAELEAISTEFVNRTQSTKHIQLHDAVYLLARSQRMRTLTAKEPYLKRREHKVSTVEPSDYKAKK
jgi:hypothetical protein